MKAVIWTKYGKAKGLKYTELPQPVPKVNEILIKIYATTVTAGDCEMRGLKFSPILKVMMRLYFGIIKPRNIILGQELAGKIVEVGNEVTEFKVGDEIIASTEFKFGAYAEYVCLKSDGVIAIKPDNTTFEAATALPVGGLEALHFLRKSQIKEGSKLLIVGAGGSIGTAAIQIAKNLGAEVTAIDHTNKLDILKFIGSNNVLDYTKDDFTKLDSNYDVIFDIIGKTHFKKSLQKLNSNGKYIIANPKGLSKIKGRLNNLSNDKKVILEMTERRKEDLEYLCNLMERGKLITIIDTYYPLQAMGKAHEYVETGQKKGNLIITVDH